MSDNSKSGPYLDKIFASKILAEVISKAVAKTIGDFTKTPVKIVSTERMPLSEKKDLQVGGFVHFEGDKISLELMLLFPKDLIFSLGEHFYGADAMDFAMAEDLAGEILNISFGTIDPTLAGVGIKLKSSFPLKLSEGALEKLLSKVEKETILVKLESGGKLFHLEILAPGSIPLKWSYTKIN